MDLTSRGVGRPLVGMVVVLGVWAIAGAAVLTHPDKDVIAGAAAFDFVVTASLVAHLLRLPRWATTTTFIVGMVLAKLAVSHALVLGVIVEACALISLVIRKRHSVIARLLATELRILAMLVVGWRKPAPAITVHKTNGWSLYAGVFAFLIAVETVPVHIAISTVAPTIAWIASALSLYSALWVVGDALALRHGGLRRRGDLLEITIGLRHRASIPVSDIVLVSRCEATSLAVGEPNVWFRLRTPVTVESMLGRRRTTSALALSVDDRDGLAALIR